VVQRKNREAILRRVRAKHVPSMSYPNLSEQNGLSKLLSKKEFSQYELDPRDLALQVETNENFLDALIRKEGNIVLHSHQLFIKNLINPNTPYDRLLVKHMTGTGKTIAALALTKNFIDVYSEEYARQDDAKYGSDAHIKTPMCYIIGFSKHVFQKELLRHPEFGFISKAEMADHKRLKHLAEFGTKLDVTALVDFETRIL
jgi:hypothetical protein